jgi:hypothetical protein
VVGLAVHLGSALNEEELGALKAAARQRLVDGQGVRLVIIQETAGDAVAAWSDVADRIVGAVAAAHGTPADAVVFVHRGSIPRTTSGKIRTSCYSPHRSSVARTRT